MMSDSDRRRGGGGGIALLLGILLVIGLILWWWFYRPFPIPGISNVASGGGAPQIATTPPNAPSNISGESVPIFDISLLWSDNSDNEDGFRIYRQRTDVEGEVLTLAGGASPNSPAFTDLDTWCGATYQYTISSFNAAGESPATECWQITLPACPQSNTTSLPDGIAGGMNFLTNATGANSDLYWALTTDNQAIFMGDQEGQKGLIDLGDVGDTPLYRVTLPAGVPYKQTGVTAVAGHTYAALARDGQDVIIFTVKSTENPMDVEYIVYTPEEAITSSCNQIGLTVPPGISYGQESSATTGGSTTGGSTTGGSTTGGSNTIGLNASGTTGFSTGNVPNDTGVATGTTTGSTTIGLNTTTGSVQTAGGSSDGGDKGGCGAPCSSADQCAGNNPICTASGTCYDAALCLPPASTGGSSGGTHTGGGSTGTDTTGTDTGRTDGGNCDCHCDPNVSTACVMVCEPAGCTP